jgi:hypothetical protein
MSYTNAPAAIWTQLRDELRTRREARDLTKALEQDLHSFRSASDLADIDAIVDRYDQVETLEIRRVLNRQRAA